MTKQENPQPQYAPQPNPNAQYGPAPQPQNAPYEQQPVNQQYFAQPQAAPVQYVVQAESLKGLKGWLMLFTICFVLIAIGSIGIFFGSMTQSIGVHEVINMLFSPIMAAASITAVVLISMNKVIGKWASIATIIIATLWSIVANIVNFIAPVSTYSSYNSYDYASTSTAETSLPVLISGIIIAILFAALEVLYFLNSRRVKETLVN